MGCLLFTALLEQIKQLGGFVQHCALCPSNPQRRQRLLLSGPLQSHCLCPGSRHLKQTSGCSYMRTGHTDHPTLTLPNLTTLEASAADSRTNATCVPAGPFRSRTAAVGVSTSHCRRSAVTSSSTSVISSRSLTLRFTSVVSALTLTVSPRTSSANFL